MPTARDQSPVSCARLRSRPLSFSLSLSRLLSSLSLPRVRRPDAAGTHAPRRRAQTPSGVASFLPSPARATPGGGDGGPLPLGGPEGSCTTSRGVASRRRQSAAPGDFPRSRGAPRTRNPPRSRQACFKIVRDVLPRTRARSSNCLCDAFPTILGGR